MLHVNMYDSDLYRSNKEIDIFSNINIMFYVRNLLTYNIEHDILILYPRGTPKGA